MNALSLALRNENLKDRYSTTRVGEEQRDYLDENDTVWHFHPVPYSVPVEKARWEKGCGKIHGMGWTGWRVEDGPLFTFPNNLNTLFRGSKFQYSAIEIATEKTLVNPFYYLKKYKDEPKLMLYVLVRLPAEVWRNYKRRKRVDAEAAQYGMERQPGETTGELKKRIIKRDMISGNYSRKDLKELLMNKFTDIASCSFIINNSPTNPTVVISVKKTDDFSGGGITFQKFTDTELSAILTEAVQYIPEKYQVTIKNKEIEEK